MRYVAFLRAINVGGKNPVRMPDLRAAFEAQGYGQVSTYLQSGNVLFTADERPKEEALDAALAEAFGFSIPVVVRSQKELNLTVASAPPGHGAPERRSDAIFVKAPLTAEEAFANAPTLKEGIDQIALGPGVVYFSRLAERSAQSRMSKLISLPMYKLMTIRTWRTVTSVLELLDIPG